MTLQADLDRFSAFPIQNSELSLWVFKKRPIAANLNPFTAASASIGVVLETELKAIVSKYQQRYTEIEEYSLLSQPNESGMLGVAAQATMFPQLKLLCDRPAHECYVTNVKQLNNAAGYVARFRNNDDLLYCVKKASNDWGTKKSKTFLNIVFREPQFEVQENPSFTIARSFDFFSINESILLSNKPAFESLLSHRETYASAFTELLSEQNFVEAFADTEPIISFVGSNAIHLRRMSVIRSRGYYNNPDYLTRLREVSNERNWGIMFDEQGRIIPTLATARAILQVLLDHRLRSELSHNTYDVPSTVTV